MFIELITTASNNDKYLQFSDYILENCVQLNCTSQPHLLTEEIKVRHVSHSNSAESFHPHLKDNSYKSKLNSCVLIEILKLIQTKT